MCRSQPRRMPHGSIDRLVCGKVCPGGAAIVANSARRANQLASCQAQASKIFCFTVILIYGINPAISRPLRDVSRSSRNGGRGMRWTLWRQAGVSALDENAAAYGEIVWSWRRDRGVDPSRPVAGAATVTTNAAH